LDAKVNNETRREMEGREGRTTIVDVARRAGVSKSTVSLVLGGSSLVAETTRERVSDAMNELGYIYHRGAATLRGAKSGVIGMVINDLSNPFYVELAIGIEQACQGGAYIPFLANTAESAVRQQQVIRSMREHGAAGLVLAPAMGTSASELKPLLAGLPVVQVMRRLPGLRASFVAPENKEGARKATAHLIAVGHNRVAFVGGISSMLVREERLAGYRLALEEAGVSLDPSLVIETTTNYSGGGTAVPQLLNLHDRTHARVDGGRRFRGGRFRRHRLRRHRRSQAHTSRLEQRRGQSPRSRFARGPTPHAPSRERRLRAGSRALSDDLGASQVLPGRRPL
jgi:LacI family transcriptional regulator